MIRKRINAAYQKTNAGEVKGPTFYFNGAFISGAFTRRRITLPKTIEDQSSSKGSSNHGNNHNFNDGTRGVSRFQWQKRPWFRGSKKEEAATSSDEKCDSKEGEIKGDRER